MAARPSLPERPCPVCGTPVEPLRAGEVLLLSDGFRFLCDAECRRRFGEGERDHDAAREHRAHIAMTSRPRPTPRRLPKRVAAPPDTAAEQDARVAPPEPPPWIGLAAAGAGAVLGALAQAPIVALFAALAIVAAAAFALFRGWRLRREVGWLGWYLAPAGVILATIAAFGARSAGDDARLWLVGAAFAAAAVLLRRWLDTRTSRPVSDVAASLLAKMPARARVPVPSEGWTVEVDWEEVEAARVRAGQEIVSTEGEIVAVDGVVQAGEALALLHPAAVTPVRRGVGDALLAGARIVDGEVRVLATRVGDERALVRPASFGDRRGPRSAPLTVLTARVTRWIGLVAVGGAVLGLFMSESGAGWAGQLSAAAAVLLAIPLVAIRRASEAPYVAAAATAAERGVAFASARTLDRAGRASVAALCTHGTITEGEPEVVELHTIGDASYRALVGLIMGAEAAAQEHPIARAVARFAEARGIEAESVRRATFLPGRGVTALAPNGQELVVGSRALLLAEGVSVAVADTEAARAEARGHTAIFVGLDGRVRAVLSLRDEDRLGARAAVQRLIDLGMEIVLISGDHRGTVEALAKHLDIGHVKAELLPEERGAEMRRLRDTGGIVAAVGRAGYDEAALSAADVQVVLGAAGAPEGERAVSLTSEDIRDAAAALWLARAARRAAWRGTLSAALGGGVLVCAAAFGLAGPGIAALLALGIDAYALPSASRLLRRIELRLPVRG